MHWKRFDNKVVVAAAVGAVADIRISLPHRSSQKENITANWWARFSYDALLLWAAPSPPPFSPCGGGGIVIRKLFRDFFLSLFLWESVRVRAKEESPTPIQNSFIRRSPWGRTPFRISAAATDRFRRLNSCDTICVKTWHRRV